VRIDPPSGSFGYRREPARGLPRETSSRWAPSRENRSKVRCASPIPTRAGGIPHEPRA